MHMVCVVLNEISSYHPMMETLKTANIIIFANVSWPVVKVQLPHHIWLIEYMYTKHKADRIYVHKAQSRHRIGGLRLT